MSKVLRRRAFLKTAAASLAAGAVPLLPGPRRAGPDAASEWRCYGSDQAASRYSRLSQINRDNVGTLKVAWVHHTEDASARPATTIECTPVVVDGRMYITTAKLQVRALDAATGEVLWN
ncbi:MAG: PQQ-binding-like beta-propeller repeat protein, partial [bacterium]|nr:PQQ-binding-like beta-propeller repeat protein [bacterium]